MAIYKTRTTPKIQAFKLHHVWNVLKDCPRWGTDADQQWGRLFHSEALPSNYLNEGASEGVNEGVEQMTPTSSLQGPREEISKRKQREKGSLKIR